MPCQEEFLTGSCSKHVLPLGLACLKTSGNPSLPACIGGCAASHNPWPGRGSSGKRDALGTSLVVPGGRVELPLSCENQILSLARLPVPPSGPRCPVTGFLSASFLA